MSSEDLWKSHLSFSTFFNGLAILFVCTHSSVVERNRRVRLSGCPSFGRIRTKKTTNNNQNLSFIVNLFFFITQASGAAGVDSSPGRQDGRGTRKEGSQDLVTAETRSHLDLDEER